MTVDYWYSTKKVFKILKRFTFTLSFIFIQTLAFSQSTTYSSAGSYTYTVPTGVTTLTVECWGAGGGGSSYNTTAYSSGGGAAGGGGGAYASSILNVTPGTTYTVVVGSGGTSNTDGGNTSVSNGGTIYVNAAGGSGGTANSLTGATGGLASASTGSTTYSGGNGGSGTNGMNNEYSGAGGGGAGSEGIGGNASGTTSGSGATKNGGNGGAGLSRSTSNGNNGSNYGGGGSGGCVASSSGSKLGGSGANGYAVITCGSYIWQESFSYTDGTNSGTGHPAIATWTADGGNRGVSVYSNVLRGRNTSNSGNDTWEINSSDPIETGGYSTLSISMDITESGNLNSADNILIQYNIDGTGWVTFTNNGSLTGNFTSATASVTVTAGTTLRIRIIMTNNNDNDYYYVDNIVVSGIEAAANSGSTYYSYQTGDWNNSMTWTHDPGGTTQTATDIPHNGDNVIILNSRTITLTEDVDTANLDITLREGGILNQDIYKFTSGIKALRGSGIHQLSSNQYPTVTTNKFVETDGGTTEYKNTSDFVLPNAQSEYYNLKINAPGIVATQLIDLNLNGDLIINQGTYRINDNSNTNPLVLNISGDVIVNNAGAITVGNGSTNTTTSTSITTTTTPPFIDYFEQFHRVVIYGSLTNNGSVRFTNLNYPVYNQLPPSNSGSTSGAASVYFMGASDNTLTCYGTTDFYNLIIDKGIDKTYKLTVYSSAYTNFRIFGANNAGGDLVNTTSANPNLKKALWIRTGTLELTGLSIIPSLVEGNDCSTSPNSDFYIPANGALLLNGPEVVVLTTADSYKEINLAYNLSIPNDNSCGTASNTCSSFSIYGLLQIDDGYISTRESAGFITWDVASGRLEINGGIVDAKQFRSAGSSGGLASFHQSGGEFILRGRFQRTPTAYSDISDLKDFTTNTINTTRQTYGLNGDLATLNINEAANVFDISGGTIEIYDVCGTGTGQNKAIGIFSDEANNNVTGGTIEIIPTTGSSTDASTFIIESKASFYNLTINRSSSTSTVSLNTYNLGVNNNLTITNGSLIANNLDVSIGKDFIIQANGAYTPGSNTTLFNGSGIQNFTINTSSTLALNKLKVDKPSNTSLTLKGSQTTLSVQDSLSIYQAIVYNGGKTVQLTGNSTTACFYNTGTFTGAGSLELIDTDNQHILSGDGNGVIGNLILNNSSSTTAPISLSANMNLIGKLTFNQNKLFDIGTYSLILGDTASIANASSSRFIETNGTAGDGGITKTYTTTSKSFTFPLGAASTNHTAAEYTPATIAFESNPTTFGKITVLPVGYEHPNTTTKGRSLTYYWRVKSTGFVLGSAVINHSYIYSQNDVVSSGDITEDGYLPAYYNSSTYAWTKGANTDVNESTNTIGGTGTTYQTLNFIDGEFTAGDAVATDPFGTPKVFYSRQSGYWDNINTWSTTGHTGAADGNIPGASDIVIIGGQDSVYLNTNVTTANVNPKSCATLKIESGSALDIGYNPACNFSIVLNHENGNGNFRLTCDRGSLSASTVRTFEFPSGDFSEFNQNLGTTELYTTNSISGTTFYLPNGTESYGNLILSPLGGSNVIFPNHNLYIYGDLITRGQNADSWFCPCWNTNYPGNVTRVSKTITIKGDLNIEGGALVWYGNGSIKQDVVIYGNVYVADNSAIDVWSNATSQNIMIGGSLINNTVGTTASGTTTPRRCDFTYLPVTFFGDNTARVTNTKNSPLTIFESVTINKGSSQADSLVIDITGTMTTPTNNWLTLQNGTLKYLRNADLSITTTSEFSIPATAGLYINSSGNDINLANANSNNNDVYLNGKLTVIDGNVFIGAESFPSYNNDIEYSGGGNSEIVIKGGKLVVNGQIRRNPSTSSGILKYTQTSGNVIINGQNTLSDNAKLEILNEGSTFNMSGGSLTIVRGNASETYGDLYLRPESYSVSGGEIIFNPGTAGDQDYIFDATCPVYNLTINGSNSNQANVKLLVSPLTIKNDLTLSTSVSSLNANSTFNIPVTINGDFENNGSYLHQENTTTFNGGVQEIRGTTSNTFYNLMVSPVTSLTLNDDITVTHDLDLDEGTFIIGANTVNVKGDVNNDATYTESSVGVILNGSSQQNLSGTGTFGRLELNNSYGAYLENDISLNKNLALTNGILDINMYLLTLGESSEIEGSNFSNTKMIASDGVFSNVGIEKVFSASTPASTVFTFPIGTSDKYTPAILTINAIGATGSVRINNINDRHPGTLDPWNVLNYYWEVESSGISEFEGKLLFNYLDEDVVNGTEADYIDARLLNSGDLWSKGNSSNVDESLNTISFTFASGTDNLSGEYTAGEDASIPDKVPEYVTNGAGINWNNKDNWTPTNGSTYPCPAGGPNGFIVHIEHEMHTNVDFCQAYKTYIDNQLIIDNGTSGHNLGTVYGLGTLTLNSGTFPAGRYSNFLDCGNNGTLEYTGNSDYTLIADLYDEVANIEFTGTGTRYLPNKNLTICETFNIDGATVDNSLYNKQLFINGTMAMASGDFVAGSGSTATVTFQGSTTQTVGGSTGDFTFNNLEINNSYGLEIGTNGNIEVSRNLILTEGLIKTSSSNQLTITNLSTSCVSPAGGQSSSYIDGPLIKTINQGDSFKFPIGKEDTFGNKLSLTATQTGTINWTAEFFAPNPTYNSYNSPLTYVNSYEYWKVSAPASNKAKINIAWDTNSDLTPANTENGTSDMRVAQYDESNLVWNELNSSATGSNTSGTVSTSSRITVPAAGYYYFTSACINVIKPRAKLTPSGAICGTSGIPVTFSSNPTASYLLSYTVDGGSENTVTINASDLPYSLPTLSSGGIYKLTEFLYEGGTKTGAVDQSEVTAYKHPTTAIAGNDQSLCGDNETVLAGNNPTVGSGLWKVISGTGGSFDDPTVNTTNFYGTNGTGYSLTWTTDNGGCTSVDTVDIDFPLLAAQPASFTAYKSNVCVQEKSVTYTVPNDATVSYTWSFDGTGATIVGTGNSVALSFNSSATSGALHVSASNSCGSSSDRTINITVNPLPEFTFVSNATNNMVCTGSTVNFSASSSSGPSIASYRFYVNGTSVQNSASGSYSSSTLTNNSQINVVALSTASCTKLSDTITMSVGDEIWNGSDNDWFTNTNWACGSVPSASDDIIIPSGVAAMPVIDASGAECKNLNLQALAQLEISGTNNLDIWGDWINNGDFTANNGTVSFEGTTSISGTNNLTLNHMIIDGSLTSSGSSLNVTGNLTNNGSFLHNNGTLIFNGTEKQSIDGDFSGTNIFNNIIIKNANGVELTNGYKEIDGTLTLSTGLLTSNDLLTLGQSATTNLSAASGKVSSYILGTLSKIIVGNSVSGFFFPIGTSSLYKPVGLSNITQSGKHTWKAIYNESPAQDNTIKSGDEMVRVTSLESWTIVSATGSAYVTLSWDETFQNSLYVDNDQLSTLRVAHLTSGSTWESMGNSSYTGAVTSFGTITSGSAISFDGSKKSYTSNPEEFTLGTTSADYHPLPVEMLYFTGKAIDEGIQLIWATATELNNDYFKIQRSYDAINFTTIATVSGSGNSSSEINYEYIDEDVVYGTQYYRLIQVDYDGNSETYPTIAVNWDSPLDISNMSFNLYPNPYSSGDLKLMINGLSSATKIDILITDMEGKTLYLSDAFIYNSTLNIIPDLLSNTLAHGIYIIKIQAESKTWYQKLVVQ